MSWQDLVVLYGHLFTNPNKRTYNAQEVSIAYQIMNAHDGTDVKDTGCSSCRRSTFARVRKIILKQT
jgi:hypothetical protein